MQIKALLTAVKNNIFLIAASGIGLVVTAYMGYKNARYDMLYADAVSDNNFLQTPFVANDIEIQEIHTHLLKWPIALLENAVGFDLQTHVIASILLLVVMNAWLGYIFYIFSKRNTTATALGIVLLVSVELLLGINANEGTLSMITIRNIELPLAITLIYFSLKSTKYISIRNALLALLFALLFTTDQLLFYTTVIGTVLYLGINTIHKRSIKKTLLQDTSLYINVFVGAILYKIIDVLFAKLGIASFYERTSDSLFFVSSANELFTTILRNIGKIFEVFGAQIFGNQIMNGWVFLLNLATLVASAILIYSFTKRALVNKQPLSTKDKTLFLLILMYFLAMLLFTVFIPRELAGRYFAFVPVIGLMLIVRRLSTLKLSPSIKYYWIVTAAIILATATLSSLMVMKANYMLYNPRYDLLAERRADVKPAVDALLKEDVSVYMDQDFWRVHIVKVQYDEVSPKQLAIPSNYCGGDEVNKQFARKSWSEPNGSSVAVRVKECSAADTKMIFGEPDKIVSLNTDDTDLLFIYNDDIRSILDLSEFEPGHIKL
jgi:hypothetical protein